MNRVAVIIASGYRVTMKPLLGFIFLLLLAKLGILALGIGGFFALALGVVFVGALI